MNEKSSLGQYLPWIAVAALAFMLWKDKAPTPDPKPDQTVTIESATKAILPSIKTANARIFEEAAAKVESGEIATDKQLLEFVQPATKAAREAANKPFDVSLDLTLPRNDDGSFKGKEIEVAKLLRKIAKAW